MPTPAEKSDDAFAPCPAAVDAFEFSSEGECSLWVAASAVACSLLLGILVIAFVVLAQAALPGYSIDMHRQHDGNGLRTPV